MCCTKSYCTFWDKGVKHVSPREKGFLRNLRWNPTASKRVSCLCTTKTEDRIFVQYFFMRVSLVRWDTRHNNIQKLWLCNLMCHTYLMIHPQRKKLEIQSRSHSLNRGVYYQKLITIRKLVTNMTMIQRLHH